MAPHYQRTITTRQQTSKYNISACFFYKAIDCEFYKTLIVHKHLMIFTCLIPSLQVERALKNLTKNILNGLGKKSFSFVGL